MMSKQDCSFVPYTFSETGRTDVTIRRIYIQYYSETKVWRPVIEGQNYNYPVDDWAIFFGAADLR